MHGSYALAANDGNWFLRLNASAVVTPILTFVPCCWSIPCSSPVVASRKPGLFRGSHARFAQTKEKARIQGLEGQGIHPYSIVHPLVCIVRLDERFATTDCGMRRSEAVRLGRLT